MTDKLYPWQEINGGISAPLGFYACGIQAGIKYQDKYDLALILSEIPASAAGMFTRNVVKAHPLVLTEKHLANGKAQAIVVNSGNANACMGEIGDNAALEMARVTAAELAFAPEDILVSSTGVIGQELPLAKVIPGIRLAAKEVQALKGKVSESEKTEYAHQAALAIMTTDTVCKELAFELQCAQGTIKLGIMAKGSGMIHPNMGTMLCFITTDAQVAQDKLKGLLKAATDESFNMVTVDGDTSTNDMVVILANGLSGVAPEGQEWENFSAMVREACCTMAKAIARDGEGASKFLEVKVAGAVSLEAARTIARSVCSSNLVKSAMYGEDANWGRILAAAGYSGASFDPNKADIYLNGLQVAAHGQGLPFSETEAAVLLKNTDIKVDIVLGDGNEQAVAWGCDLTHKYIDINADYRT
ncbi:MULTISPECIES: bifunctional glutamate N-acetyltransferase/amino-acid acetyltransferase ArgJ [unclassified Dehalobacter]|uniref:bifunctional glutamate N-acetyltransferase/amino-acid acetyltransferase ArgJ n=1 Tax=unclassified Dehalobacter TaxID=2635733 RepID=UPI000E6D01EB|nr:MULTISPECIES: bifunctional glutamate N-acetyltransferase/amino-acid acetyltransferase ArgJ [unclassified Dehalobacter]RJE48159.1 bifunctional ornithine acetyltransferase/N-acetylglutamate synthase [Dehalobacter sp. MCB1]TCX49633.1 ornithine acetyltransferase [Dehalobacter sp. 14DCB1]TCX50243.1 ornithine acetyltransferase [Dehalobacter sp. 12DCB1]